MVFQYYSVTKSIEVEVIPSYLEEQSVPHENCYIWLYSIKIKNKSESTVQLLRRNWKIIDSRGVINEITGSGVVGKQPILKPGEFFEYTSGAYLNTPSGIMHGEYQFMDENAAQVFYVDIPTFSLDSPYDNVKPN
ncbi:Co2+/Mg2+ efflux protein ApaG [Candidatus Neoehrlichia procyonis]|uniref:Protein ApaG n=1 Tax=Candidatus Neoehrlichia procyonis str. RAC413 TaxID=1359163 RepID=A0A0F3NN54_9RICK|nr:Co2+/Mg2+ efflux protein ApaG [Candidatus Neoehrlichia lotoris]KJV69498.1 hypothetical protein NLO413_0891 [Candidatus Neoehrlichia lotoris str. RAC413]